MKKLLSLIVALFAILPIFAYDFDVDGIYYNKLSDNTVEVTYREVYFYSYSGDVTIPETVTYNGVTYSVSSIGAEAFRSCYGLTSVTIPNSVTEIGDYAFSGCSGLTSVSIPNSVTEIGERAFSGCSGLTSVSIPNSVTEIGEYCFYGCSGLTSVSIPNSVTSIGEYAFFLCRGLTSVSIPNSVTEIGSGAFSNCSGLTSVTIPNSVTKIGASAFFGCSGLTKVEISDIAAWCKIYFYTPDANPLYYAHHLYLNGNEVTDLVIPNSVTRIGNYCFYDCSGLTNLYIGEKVSEIGSYAFSRCESIEEIAVAAVVPPATDIHFSFDTPAYNNATLCVPKESIEAYKTTYPWLYFLTIKTLDESGVNAVSENSEAVFDICSVNGVLLKRGATQADVDALAPGIYIAGGKKLLVK